MDRIAEINGNGRLVALLEQAGIRGRQMADAFQFTTDSIMQVIKEELKKGNMQEVLSILKGKPLAAGQKMLKNEITGRVVTGLMLRFGLRKIAALAIAALIIPFVIARITHKIGAGNHVPDFILSLNIKNKIQEMFAGRNAIQPAPEPLSVTQTKTNEMEFLTD